MSQNYSGYNVVKACLYLQEIYITDQYISTGTITQLYSPLNAVIPIIGDEGSKIMWHH